MKQRSKKLMAILLTAVMVLQVGTGFSPVVKAEENSNSTQYDYSFDLTYNQSYGTSLDEAFNVYNYTEETTTEAVSSGEPSSSSMATMGYKNARNNGYLKFGQTNAGGTYLSAMTYMTDVTNFTAEVTYYTYIYQTAGIMFGGEAGTFPITFDGNPYNDTGVLIYLSGDGKNLNIAGAIDRATTNYLGGTKDGTDFGGHNGFSGTAGIQGKTTFTTKVSSGNQYVKETDPYINLVITVNDGLLTVYEKDNPANVVTVALLDSYVGGTVSFFSKNDNTSFKSFGIKALPDTEVNSDYSFNLTKSTSYGTTLNKAFNIYNYTDKATTTAASVGEPSDSAMATMSSSYGTRNGGYLKLKGAQNGSWISTMTYLPKVTNFKAEVTYYTYMSQIAGIMFGGEAGTFPITFDSNNSNDKGVMIFLEDSSMGRVLNIGGAIVPETTNYLGGTTAGDDFGIGGQSNFSGTANVRGYVAITEKAFKGANPVADDDTGITLVITVKDGILSVYEKDSPDKVVTVQLAESYEGGTVSLYTQHYNSSFKAFSIEKYPDPIDYDYSFNLTKNQSYGTSLDEKFNVYNYDETESTTAVSSGEPSDSTMATIGYYNTRNNGYLKLKQAQDTGLSTLTYMEEVKNFTAEVTYYSYMFQIAGIMIGGEAGTFPITFDSNPYNDKGALIYLDNATEGQILNIAGAIDRATTNYLGGTTDGTDFGGHNGFSGTAGIKGKTNFTSKVFAGNQNANDADPYITLVITVNDGVLTVYEKDNPKNIVSVTLLDSYVGGTVSLFSKHTNTSFKSFGIKSLPDTETNPNYSFNLTKSTSYGTTLNKAFNIYNYTDKVTTTAASVGEPSDSAMATMSSSYGTRNGGYLKLKGAQNGSWISTMTYLPKVTNFKAEVTYYTYMSQIAGIMFGGEAGTFPITFDSNNSNDKGVMIFLEDSSMGRVLNIGGAIVPETTNYLGGTTAGDDFGIGGQSNFSGTANVRGYVAITEKAFIGANPVADDDTGITLVITVNNGILSVYEKESPDKVVTVQLAESYEGGTVSLYTQHYNSSFKAFSIEKYEDPEIDPNLIKFDNKSLDELKGWTSHIYNTSTGEKTEATELSEQWFTGMSYPTSDPNWNSAFNKRNNPGLKPLQVNNETNPAIITSPENYENFESYITYYQNSMRYGMIFGEKGVYPTTLADSAVYVYLNGKELTVRGAIDINTAVTVGELEGTILKNGDTIRLNLTEYGFAPDAASATKTVTVHVKVEDGVATISVDDIQIAIQVNLAANYVHGGISLVATGCAHGGFKYLRVEELAETQVPEVGETSYTMASKDEYAIVTVNREVDYSSLKADVNYDVTKYEYVKAIFDNNNYRINGAGKKEFANDATAGKVSVEAYSNSADSYVSLYFKTVDGTQATDFTGFTADNEQLFVVGGKEIGTVSSTSTLEQDYKQDKVLNIVDLVCAKKAGNDETIASRKVLLGTESVSELFGKTALFLGDSIMNSVTDGMGWYGRLEAYGMECDEVAQDGWALTSGTGRNRIISQFQYADADKAYDFVLLEGGVNDILISEDSTNQYAANISWGDEDENITLDSTTYDDKTIAGAMQELIVETQQRYGNAKIVYIINSEFGGNAEDKARFIALVEKVCEVHGIDSVNLSDTENYPELEVINDKNHAEFRDYMVDNIHPNAKSYDLTTPIVAEKMEEIVLNSK